MALDPEDDADTGGRAVRGGLYKRRQVCHIERYRVYDKEDVKNHKRKMMTLHTPFRDELMEILDREKFLRICEKNENVIMEKRREFKACIDIEEVMQEIEATCLTKDRLDWIAT